MKWPNRFFPLKRWIDCSKLFLIGGALAVTSLEAYTPVTSHRVYWNFNPSWKFSATPLSAADSASAITNPAFNDASWAVVSLPHTTKWLTVFNSHQVNGIVWYRKHFSLPSSYQGRKVFIQFLGAMQLADVWLNGVHLTQHQGGFMEFTLDATNNVSFGTADNILTARLDNTPNTNFPPGNSNPDLSLCGGLYRDVKLYVTDRLHVTDAVFANKVAGGGIFVTYPSVSAASAVVNVQTDVTNENSIPKNCTVVSEITDAGGAVVQSSSSAMTIPAGFDTAFSQSITVGNAHLWYPDTPYLYALHTIIEDSAAPVDTYTTRIGIRTIHWSHTAPALTCNGKSYKLFGGDIEQDIYGIGNAQPQRAIYNDMRRFKEAGFDFARLSCFPHHPALYDACDELGIVIQDEMTGWQYFGGTAFQTASYNECEQMIRRDRNHPCVFVWETSLNESNFTTAWASAMSAHANAEYPAPSGQFWTCAWQNPQYFTMVTGNTDAGIRTSTSSQPITIDEGGDWEYGGLASTSRVLRTASDSSLLKQCTNCQFFLDSNLLLSWYSAGAYFVYEDYAGYGDSTFNPGVMSMDRIPKFAYYFFQSQRDPSVISPNFHSGPMVYIANRWAPGSPATVRVFSNCQQVSLYLNDTLFATQSPGTGAVTSALPHAPFIFNLPTYKSGTLKAVGLINGSQVATFIRQTPGMAKTVRLRAEENTLLADSSDARLVWIDIIDSNGTVVPTATNQVTISIVSGPGTILGPNPLTMMGGQLATWIRGSTTGGLIIIQGTATGLTPGFDTLNAMAPSVTSVISSRPVAKMNRQVVSPEFFKVTDGMFFVPEKFAGHCTMLSVYDLSGKLLKTIQSKSRVIDLHKEIGRSAAEVYLVKIIEQR